MTKFKRILILTKSSEVAASGLGATWSLAILCNTLIKGNNSLSIYAGLDVQQALSIISGPNKAPAPPGVVDPAPPEVDDPAAVLAPADFSYVARPSNAYLLTQAYRVSSSSYCREKKEC